MAFPERGVILHRRNLKISSPPPDLMICRVSEKPEGFFSSSRSQVLLDAEVSFVLGGESGAFKGSVWLILRDEQDKFVKMQP